MALPVQQAARDARKRIWRNQLQTIVRLEIKKNFFRWRGLWVYFLAFGPAVIIGLHTIASLLHPDRMGAHPIDEDTNVLASIFRLFYLHLGIYFGCMGIFTRLFRGEMMERSLHYYFLAPVRRELLVIGKFLAGVVAASTIFSVAVIASYFLMYGHYGAEGRQFVLGAGLQQLGAYVLVTVLGCIGYGALFLLMGLLFKNPIVPAVVIAFWESINGVLPAWLKKFSVIFYLEPLCPIDVQTNGLLNLFLVSADPIPGYVAVPGLLIVSTAILGYACVKIRTVEINYSSE